MYYCTRYIILILKLTLILELITFTQKMENIQRSTSKLPDELAPLTLHAYNKLSFNSFNLKLLLIVFPDLSSSLVFINYIFNLHLSSPTKCNYFSHLSPSPPHPDEPTKVVFLYNYLSFIQFFIFSVRFYNYFPLQ